MINREIFYKNVKSLRPLKQSQVNALNFLLDKLDNSIIKSSAQQAYVLATIFHETAFTFAPIKEMGGIKYLSKKSYYPYFGRGYVQLTWYSNYRDMGIRLFNDPNKFISNPDLLLDPENAWKVTEIGMVKGTFTGKKLSDYISDSRVDFKNARRIINGTDKASTIAGYAQTFYKALQEAKK